MPRPKPRDPAGIDPARAQQLADVADRVGHTFDDLRLLDRALTHASLGNSGRPSYERLEFLGDAILGFLVAEALYRARPDGPQGDLTDWRAQHVSRQPLAEIARTLELPEALAVGRGLRSSELESPRIQADLVEAVLGALYLDGGLDAARRFVRAFVLDRDADELPPVKPERRDPKSRLLHLAQSERLGQPTYSLITAEGPDHRREFTVAVEIRGERYGTGTANSKQAAEKRAAAEAWDRLRAELDGSHHAEAD